ncbi:MAG: YraN family protein [Bacteroidia bacterium]|nr:YraN family protein [Bacteroidia bacterium]
MAEHLETGKKGEAIASEFLSNKGYRILEHNWRHGHGEVDIIAMAGDILVFVEVKTRSANYFGEPASFVDNKKMEKLSRIASVYMEKIRHDWEIRFDIIGVLIKGPQHAEITHYEDAWFPGWG